MKFIFNTLMVSALVISTLYLSGCRSKKPLPEPEPLSITSKNININGAEIEAGMNKPAVMRQIRTNKNIYLPPFYRNSDSPEYKNQLWEIPVLFITRYALLQIYYKGDKVKYIHLKDLE